MKVFEKHKVHFGVWHYDIMIVITDDYVAAAKKLQLTSLNGGPTDDTGAICFHERDCARTHLLLHPDQSAGDIAHEAWHCIRRMLLYCGADLDSETVAYHLGFLVDGIHKFLKGMKK